MRHVSSVCAVLAGVIATCIPTSAGAQFGDLLNKLVAPVLKAGEAPSHPVTPAPGSTSEALVFEAPAAGPNKNVDAEMLPDTNCSRPQERFNIAEKVADYGGTQASLRLQRLIESDFRYSDLKPEDKKMLAYLARTTVWLPVEVEAKLGTVFDGGGSLFKKRPELSPLDQAAVDQVNERLTALKGVVTDFPADVRLSVDKSMPDGASARFGGVIQLSERFLGSVSESPAGADFLLAHELSHVYKRHAVKDMQFKLISTEEGWELGRKVLQRAQRGMAVDPINDGVFLFTTVPKLIEFVRSIQLKYGRHQELEADACAVVWLTGIGSDPITAWDAYKATIAASAGGPSSYAPSHPSSEEREARFRRKAGGGETPATPKAQAGPARRAKKG